jgi:ABC-type transporter Mla MlaB component
MTDAAIRCAVTAEAGRADIADLCSDLADRLRGRSGDVVVCDVTGVTEPDVVTVETLARLRLTARRHGARLVVTGAGPHLRDLVQLLGLEGALPDLGGQPEEREQPGGVEEERLGRDPPL